MITFLWIIIGLLLAFTIFTAIFAIKYHNKYRMYMCIGKPGAGKSTTMVKLAYEYNKKGMTVYTTSYIPGTYHIDVADLCKVELKPDSVLMIDEASTVYDNRNFKKFTEEQRDYWVQYRHRKIIVWFFSQDFNIDLKLRRLVHKLYCCINYFGVYTVLKEVKRKFPVITQDQTGESQITDTYVVSPFILAPFGARKFVFIPRWARFFNSFETKPLAIKDFKFVDYPDWYKKHFKKKHK